MSGTIETICNGLKKYYQSLDAKYDDLFTEYCEDNGLDSDAVIEEFDADPADSILADFDDKFPFAKQPTDEQKPQEILDIIQKCYNNPNITFTDNMPKFDKDLFDITEDDINEIKELYSSQCPVLWNSGMENDNTFLYILAVGHKHKFDYLQHLVDDYFRGRVNNMDKSLSEEKWSEKHRHFNRLKKIDVKFPLKDNDEKKKKIATLPHELAAGAVKAFGARCTPKLLLSPLIQINDSLEITVRYIDAAIDFISDMISKANKMKKTICPFQLDFCIAAGAPNNKEIKDNLIGHDGDDDDDDDDGDDAKETFIDCIGDIVGKLNKNKLPYEVEKYKSDFGPIKGRVFGDLFERFKKKNGIQEEEEEKKEKKEKKEEELFDYPYCKRFITLIDRRNKDNKDNDNDNDDNIFMYSPPLNCRNIPNNAVPEWYISSSRTCLLPNMEYGDGSNAEIADKDKTGPNATSEMLLNSNIGSSFHCKGGLLTLSFIVKELDAIKCYLYWNGQIIRFMPKDIKTVLPALFDMTWNDGQNSNQLFLKSKEIDQLIKKMEIKIVDKYYQSFCNSYAK